MNDQIIGSSGVEKGVGHLRSESSDHLLSDGLTSPVSSVMSAGNGPRLSVPNILEITDKTPTPTKLLQAVDEIGLFQDEDEDEEHRQKNVELLKDRLVGNPFDEHFRKATQMQKDGLSNENEKREKKVILIVQPRAGLFGIFLYTKCLKSDFKHPITVRFPNLKIA